jgi:hypothetical protein
MRAMQGILLTSALVAIAAPVELWAQGRGRGHGKRIEERRIEARFESSDRDRVLVRGRDGLVIVDRRILDDRHRFDRRRGQGPAFCRSGAGHPVHGRRWCIEKGWGLGRGDVFDDGRVIVRRDGGRVIVRRDDDVVIRRRDRRDTIERIVDKILLGD